MTQQTKFFTIEEVESEAKDVIIKHIYDEENKECGAYIESIIGEKLIKIARNRHKRLDSEQTLEQSLNLVKELVDDCLYYKNNINDYVSCFIRLLEAAEKAGFNLYDLLKNAEDKSKFVNKFQDCSKPSHPGRLYGTAQTEESKT
jgi:hypothetical protein